MTPDQAREKAWAKRIDDLLAKNRCPCEVCAESLNEGFDAGQACVWEECGVPTRDDYYYRWSGLAWVEVWVAASEGQWTHGDRRVKNLWRSIADTPAHHWRRLRLPPPPEGE